MKERRSHGFSNELSMKGILKQMVDLIEIPNFRRSIIASLSKSKNSSYPVGIDNEFKNRVWNYGIEVPNRAWFDNSLPIPD
jgi:hypothetical protein